MYIKDGSISYFERRLNTAEFKHFSISEQDLLGKNLSIEIES
jgi:hypothetical protein